VWRAAEGKCTNKPEAEEALNDKTPSEEER
jgi:hypothetical protein